MLLASWSAATGSGTITEVVSFFIEVIPAPRWSRKQAGCLGEHFTTVTVHSDSGGKFCTWGTPYATFLQGPFSHPTFTEHQFKVARTEDVLGKPERVRCVPCALSILGNGAGSQATLVAAWEVCPMIIVYPGERYQVTGHFGCSLGFEAEVHIIGSSYLSPLHCSASR